MAQQPSKKHKNPTKLLAKPKYSDQPFSAWKSYIDDEEEPDCDFINWKKEVLGESASTANKNKSKQERVDQATGVSTRTENKVKAETATKDGGKTDTKHKQTQKEPAVLVERENHMKI